jgi:hypothetical protein
MKWLARPSLFLAAALIASSLLAATACARATANPRAASSQSDYPDLPEYSGLVDFALVENMNQLVSMADEIIQGEIAAILPIETRTVTWGNNPAESAVQSKASQSVWVDTVDIYSFRVLVHDVIKGPKERANQEITISISGLVYDAYPKMAVKDQFIFFLEENQTNSHLLPLQPPVGLFYYAWDDKVYPLDSNGRFARTSGMAYDAFRQLVIDNSTDS